MYWLNWMNWMGFSSNTWRLISVDSLLKLCTALAGIFVNIFLWKIDSRLETLAWFNLWMFASVLVSVVLAGYIAKRWHSKWALLVGIGGYVSFYGLLLLLQSRSVDYLVLLGILDGIGVGFSAIGLHVLTYDMTHNDQRDRYYSLLGIIGSATGMLAPVLSGWVITRFSGIGGYNLIFGLTLGLFLAAAVISFMFPDHTARSRLELRKVLTPLTMPSRWRAIMGIHFLIGIRDGLFAFIISIYIYSVTQSELGVGKFNLIMSAVSLLAFFFLNRTVRVTNRMKFALIGSIMVFFGIMTLSFFPNTWGVVIFNLALAIFNPFWAVPFGSISFEIISSLPQGRERRVEFIVAREIPLGIGRLLSLATFLLLVEYMSSWSVTTYMLRALSVILVVSWWILNRYTRNYAEGPS